MTIRIMSANLFNGRTRPEALASALDEVEPDVVACQELAPNAAEVIADRFPHGTLEARTDYWGGGIAASREVHVSTVPLQARDGWSAGLDPSAWPELGVSMSVTSVHFTNPIVRPVRTSLDQRRGQLAGSLTHIEETSGPLVLVGDFNSTPAWPAYRRLAESIEDGVAAIGAHRRTWGPWSWFPRVLRIDHAFVRGARVVSARQVRIAGMDHSALVVDVTTDV